MENPLVQKAWSPFAVGAAIGLLSRFAFATADQGADEGRHWHSGMGRYQVLLRKAIAKKRACIKAVRDGKEEKWDWHRIVPWHGMPKLYDDEWE